MQDKEILQLMLEELRLLRKTFKGILRTNNCSTHVIDLTVAHVNISLEIAYENRVYLFLDIERADSAFTYILTQPHKTRSEVFTAPTGMFFHEFTELYFTNVAAVGIGVILTGWYDE